MQLNHGVFFHCEAEPFEGFDFSVLLLLLKVHVDPAVLPQSPDALIANAVDLDVAGLGVVEGYDEPVPGQFGLSEKLLLDCIGGGIDDLPVPLGHHDFEFLDVLGHDLLDLIEALRDAVALQKLLGELDEPVLLADCRRVDEVEGVRRAGQFQDRAVRDGLQFAHLGEAARELRGGFYLEDLRHYIEYIRKSWGNQ